MHLDQMFRVVGIRVNGDRLVITKGTDRNTAERVVNLMTGSTFVELSVEADGDGETPSENLAPVGFNGMSD